MKQLIFLILSMLAAATGVAGTLSEEFFDCSPEYKLFSVSWAGPWTTRTPRNLEWNITNANGTWSVVVPSIGDSGCWIPATNLRWYRVRGCGNFGCYADSNVIWVPQQRCTGGPNSPRDARTRG